MPTPTEYKATALAAARAANVTPQAILAATYSQVAAFAGAAIGPNGESPSLFKWRAIRKYVAAMRRDDQRADMVAMVAGQIQTAVRARAGWADAVVTHEVIDDEQHFIVARGGP